MSAFLPLITAVMSTASFLLTAWLAFAIRQNAHDRGMVPFITRLRHPTAPRSQLARKAREARYRR